MVVVVVIEMDEDEVVVAMHQQVTARNMECVFITVKHATLVLKAIKPMQQPITVWAEIIAIVI